MGALTIISTLDRVVDIIYDIKYIMCSIQYVIYDVLCVVCNIKYVMYDIHCMIIG